MIEKAFAYHKPSSAGLEKIAKLREAASVYHDVIKENGTPSREQSLALTKLEECAMWAVKSVVCNDPESEVLG